MYLFVSQYLGTEQFCSRRYPELDVRLNGGGDSVHHHAEERSRREPGVLPGAGQILSHR